MTNESRPTFRGIPPRERGRYPIHRDTFDIDRLPADRQDVFRAVERRIAEPFRGITTGGTVVPHLFAPHRDQLVDMRPVVDAARDYLAALSRTEDDAGHLDMDSPGWRRWTNAFATWPPHGLLLDDLTEPQRAAALRLMAASLSAPGYRKVRQVMLLNGLLGDLIDDYPGTLREFMYRFTVFGSPRAGGAWGWQLAGHHLDVHCVFVDGNIVLTPTFMGAEPTEVDTGPHAGLRAFVEEASGGRELMASLERDGRDTARLFPSMRTAELPAHLNHPTEGRMRAAAGADNLILPYEGLPAAQMSDASRALLRDLMALYVAILPDGAARARRAEIDRHLDDTHFCWVGGWAPDSPFYYRVHSPVILIEFDHHRGVFLANEEPTPFHVHTVVRTPNGNDYGRDLLPG